LLSNFAVVVFRIKPLESAVRAPPSAILFDRRQKGGKKRPTGVVQREIDGYGAFFWQNIAKR